MALPIGVLTCEGPCVRRRPRRGDEDDDHPLHFIVRGSGVEGHLNRYGLPRRWMSFPLRTLGWHPKKYVFSRREGYVVRMGEIPPPPIQSLPDWVFWISNDLVEKGHAELLVDVVQGIASLRDLDSTNGTFLNGAKLVPHQIYRLSCGDVIALGEPLKIFAGDKNNVFLFNLCHHPLPPSPLGEELMTPETLAARAGGIQLISEAVSGFLDTQSLLGLRLSNSSWGLAASRILESRSVFRTPLFTKEEDSNWTSGWDRNRRMDPSATQTERLHSQAQFVEVFGPQTQRHLTPRGFRVFSIPAPLPDFAWLWEEMARFFSDILPQSGINLKTLSIGDVDSDLPEVRKALMTRVFEKHGPTLENLSLNLEFQSREEMASFLPPDTTRLPRVTTLTLSHRIKEYQNQEQEKDLIRWGQELTTILPNLTSLCIGSSPPLLKTLLTGASRTLTSVTCPLFALGDLVTVPDLTLPLLKTLKLESGFEGNNDSSQENLDGVGVVLKASAESLEELSVDFCSFGSIREDEDFLKFPKPMEKLKRISFICTGEICWGWVQGEGTLSFPCNVSLGEGGFGRTLPALEALDFVVEDHKDTDRWPPGRHDFPVDWTPLANAFLLSPNNVEEDVLSLTLKTIILDPEFKLGEYQVTPGMLRKAFPSLKDVLDQNGQMKM